MRERIPSDCTDCGVEPGERHREGCDTGRCSVCGGQRLMCEMMGQHPEGDGGVWTGLWPGVIECREWGLWVTEESVMHPNNRPFVKCGPDDPDRTEDLNELGLMAMRGAVVWNGERWVKPITVEAKERQP